MASDEDAVVQAVEAAVREVVRSQPRPKVAARGPQRTTPPLFTELALEPRPAFELSRRNAPPCPPPRVPVRPAGGLAAPITGKAGQRQRAQHGRGGRSWGPILLSVGLVALIAAAALVAAAASGLVPIPG
jgi:hypothetical protein